MFRYIKTQNTLSAYYESVEIDQLKLTENGRYLLECENIAERYKFKTRVSFVPLSEDRNILETEHIVVKREDDEKCSIHVKIELNDFRPSVLGCDRCNYKEKDKGINGRIVVDTV